MKIPTKCPCCNGPMLNEQLSSKIWKKSCLKKIDHKFSAVCIDTYDVVLNASLQINENSYAIWNFEDDSKNVIIKNGRVGETFKNNWHTVDLVDKQKMSLKDTIKKSANFQNQQVDLIPYFEPTFSEYKKLIKKLKSYIVLL